MFEALGLLTGRQRQGDSLDAIRLKAIHQSLEIERRNVLIGDDGGALSLQARGNLAPCTADEARSDQNIIGTVRERHMHEAFIGWHFVRCHGSGFLLCTDDCFQHFVHDDFLADIA